jgi:hypothetical protein
VQFGIYVDAGYPTDLHWLDIPQETLILGLSAGGLKIDKYIGCKLELASQRDNGHAFDHDNRERRPSIQIYSWTSVHGESMTSPTWIQSPSLQSP